MGSPFDAVPDPDPVPALFDALGSTPNLGAGRFFAGEPAAALALAPPGPPALPPCPPRRGDPGVGFGSGNLTPDPDEEGGACCGLELTPKTGGSALALPNPHDCCCANPAPAPGAGCCCCGGLPALLSPPRVGNGPLPPPGAPQLPPLPPRVPSRPFGPGTGPPLCNPSGAGGSAPDAKLGALFSPSGAGIFLPPLPSVGPPAGDIGLAPSKSPGLPFVPVARSEPEDECSDPPFDNPPFPAAPDAPAPAFPSSACASSLAPSSFCSAAGFPTSCDTSPDATASARSSSSRSAYISSTSPNSSKSSWFRST